MREEIKEESEKKDYPCHKCRGKGIKRGTVLETCPVCKGKGRVKQRNVNCAFESFSAGQICPECEGAGKESEKGALGNIFDANSPEELFYHLQDLRRENKTEKKPRRLFRFFSTIFTATKQTFDYWSNILDVVADIAIVAIIAAFVVAFVVDIAAFVAAIVVAIIALIAIIAATIAKTEKVSLIFSLISLCLSSVSLWLSKDWLGIVGLSLIFAFSIINVVIFIIRNSRKAKRQEQEVLTPELFTSEQIKLEIAEYVRGIIDQFREEYPLTQAQKELKLKQEENSALIMEIKARLQGVDVADSGELEETLIILQSEQSRIRTELSRFSTIEDKILKVIGEAEAMTMRIEHKFGNQILIKQARQQVAEVDAILERANQELQIFILSLGKNLSCLNRVMLCLQAGGQPRSITEADEYEELLPVRVSPLTAVFMERVEGASVILDGYFREIA